MLSFIGFLLFFSFLFFCPLLHIVNHDSLRDACCLPSFVHRSFLPFIQRYFRMFAFWLDERLMAFPMCFQIYLQLTYNRRNCTRDHSDSSRGKGYLFPREYEPGQAVSWMALGRCDTTCV